MLYALAIGVDAYADRQIAPLRHARADAEAIAAMLRERVADARSITLLVEADATRGAVERILTEELPRRVGVDDVLLLYFAGYGAPEVDPATGDPSCHLVLSDTRYADLSTTAINVVSELGPWLRRLPARLVTSVFDASFSGAPGGRTFEGPGLWSGPRIRRLERVSPARLAHGTQHGVLTGCAAKEVAREDSELGHGVFTFHLLEALRGPVLGGPAVRVDALHAIVANAVRVATQGEQNPALHGATSARALFRLRDAPPPGGVDNVQNSGLADPPIGHEPVEDPRDKVRL
jgi:uncharacterized caspase-like protein